MSFIGKPSLSGLLALCAACALSACSDPEAGTDEAGADGAELEITTFNPGEASVFPVASNIIAGPTEVVLIDAQFQKNDAETLRDQIVETGLELTTIYISHGDPDYYFGLDVLTEAFPDAAILASPTTREYIEGSQEQKFTYWSPILGENAPGDVIIPDVIEGDTLYVDGVPLKIVGLDGHDPKHTFVWVESESTILGGVSLFDNMHVWMADAQTAEARDKWRETLSVMEELSPERAIPGHFVGETPAGTGAIGFTRDYLSAFEAAAADADTSEGIIATMTQAYPDFTVNAVLQTSAGVYAGEITWP